MALSLDHDGRPGLGQGIGPVVQPVDRLAAFANRAQQGVALFQQVTVAGQLPGMLGIDL